MAGGSNSAEENGTEHFGAFDLAYEPACGLAVEGSWRQRNSVQRFN